MASLEQSEIPNVARKHEPGSGHLPLVFDSPHSGLGFPDDFQPALPLDSCERVADWFIEDLFSAVTDHGGALIEALFRRAYIDPNRETTDLDISMIEGDWPHPVIPTEKTKRGASLIWRALNGKSAIYDRKLAVEEVHARIETYWRPYHDMLRRTLDDRHDRFGQVFHINCHSMQEFGEARWGDQGSRRADFIIGTRDGTTAGDAFTEVVAGAFRDAGYSVGINDQFKGVALVQLYSDPANERHSLQIEVNRGLYMDEDKIIRNDRYDQTKADITAMIGRVADFARSRL